MTCMKQEFCIHEKYCQRHIGQNFDSCILFSRNSKPMTNKEYYTETDEELAIFLARTCRDLLAKVVEDGGKVPNEYDEENREFWEMWLKEIHDG